MHCSAEVLLEDSVADNKSLNHANQEMRTSPSGATDKTKEREKKFDEEGGDQPQAPSQKAVDEELHKIRKAENPTGRVDGDGPKRPN